MVFMLQFPIIPFENTGRNAIISMGPRRYPLCRNDRISIPLLRVSALGHFNILVRNRGHRVRAVRDTPLLNSRLDSNLVRDTANTTL